METRRQLATRLVVLCVLAMLLTRDAGAQLRVPQVPISGGGLQTYFHNVGESIDVQTSQAAIQWLPLSVNNSTFTLQVEFSAGSGGSSIGFYDAAAAAPALFEMFPPYAGVYWFAVISLQTAPIRAVITLYDGLAVLQKSTTHFGVNRNAVGFYLDGPGGRVYSQDAKNPAGAAQVLWFAGTGINACSWWIAMEDTSVNAGSDTDFDDVVLFVEAYFVGLCPTSVQRSTWGTLKARFR